MELIYDDHLQSLWDRQQITDTMDRITAKNKNIDGIILYSTQTEKGTKIEDETVPLFKGGKHPYIGAAYLKKGLSLEDMKRSDLNIISIQPPIFYNPNFKPQRYKKTDTIVPYLSFVWFVAILIVCSVVIWMLINFYPRDRYVYVKNKRIVIEPGI